MRTDTSVLFIYRGPHPVHKKFAEAIGAEFLFFRPPFFRPSVLFGALGKVLHGYRVIYCEESSSLPLAWVSKKLYKSKVILWGGDSLFYGLFLPKRIFVHRMCQIVDGFIAPSKYIAEQARKVLKCRIEIVHPAVDVRRFLRVRADLSSRNICFVGTYSKRKGIERAVQALKIIRREYPETKLYLIGEIPRKFAEDGVVLTGRVPFPETYMKKCSIYVHPAVYEPFGTTVIEAILAGLVPVVSKDTGAKEFVDRELVVDGSPLSLAGKVIELFERGPRYLVKLQAVHRRRVLEANFDFPQKMKEFSEKFWKIVES